MFPGGKKKKNKVDQQIKGPLFQPNIKVTTNPNEKKKKQEREGGREVGSEGEREERRRERWEKTQMDHVHKRKTIAVPVKNRLWQIRSGC